MVTKQPDLTRQTILEAALWEIYRNGFQAASIDQILAGTGLTKGALYHHFPNKKALGLAVVDEIIYAWIIRQWIEPLEAHANPVDGLLAAIRQAHATATPEMLNHGCPLNNLVQEMAPVDEDFRERLERVTSTWRGGIARHLARGQQEGTVRTDLDPDAIAAFLVASFEGMAGSVKSARSPELAQRLMDVFCGVLESLRPANIPEASVAP